MSEYLLKIGSELRSFPFIRYSRYQIKDIDKTTVLKKLNLQTNCSRVDGDQFENLPSGQYFPRADDTSNLPVFFFGGRDSVY